METNRVYIAIDLKSFYASVECVERGRNPLTTHLVVADKSRTEKTICLAVSPSLKTYGIPGRARLFEVVQKVREINAKRRCRAPGGVFQGVSDDAQKLEASPALEVNYIVAPPQMALYMKYSARIYDIYLKYVAPEDIHVYSIDEVFMDVTNYLGTYRMSARELVQKIIHDILESTGITATAGIGTNLYLSKVAMDIVAKRIEPDQDGVRIAELDEMSYRELLWSHRPLTDFWRVGKGYARKLEERGLYTMGDVARCSIGRPSEYYNEDLLYQTFGVNAELLIDHAWGWEPCTIAAIKAYKPSTNSLSSGQVLQCPYEAEKAEIVLREMADALSLDLVEQGLVTDQIVLTVGYDRENITDSERRRQYTGAIELDRYGRKVPKQAHGSIRLDGHTSSTRKIIGAASKLFDQIVDKSLLIRRMYIVANHVIGEADASEKEQGFDQLDLFTDYAALEAEQEAERVSLDRERKLQEATLAIKKKFGKNAILKGMNLEAGATAKDRNARIGGHKA